MRPKIGVLGFVLLPALLAAPGCGSDAARTGSDEAGSFGSDCSSNDDCDSDLCLRLDGESMCTRTCDSDCDCPGDHTCAAATEPRSVCAPGTSMCARDAGTGGGGCGGGCPDGQVCSDGSCEDLPDSCPCPAGSYCEIETDTCKAGCRSDGHCAEGEICEDDECRAGCRGDDDCGSGEICDETLTCRDGCRGDEDCASGDVCDGTTCRTGCNSDAECTGSGQVCDESDRLCRTGCREHADCGTGEICDTYSATCIAGCLDDSDCTEAGTICEGMSCIEGCREHPDCSSDVCRDNVCQEPRCGDGVVNQPSEECDGSAPSGSCRDLHESYAGTATCTSSCTLTNSSCCIRTGYSCSTASSALPCCSYGCSGGTCG